MTNEQLRNLVLVAFFDADINQPDESGQGLFDVPWWIGTLSIG